MKAVRLHGPRDLRVEDVPPPPLPGPGEALIRVGAVGICGSDLHTYTDGRIGDTEYKSPSILGHEFMGTVIAVGKGALDGNYLPLEVGSRVAVDPAVPKEQHELFEKGHPNLVPEAFYGLYPDDGALRESMVVISRNCFPISGATSDSAGTLLETLGVALHATDLGRLKVAETAAVIGCGPVGLLILKLVELSGASKIYGLDLHQWRVNKARSWGATEAWRVEPGFDPAATVTEATGGRGVDVVFEAAWADASVATAGDMVRPGGRLVLVGIPGDDRLVLNHSTFRRKGLTIFMSRRMKHTYPRAIELAESGTLDLDDLVSHRFELERAAEAFELNESYGNGVHKIVIEVDKQQG
jgi:L-iditol 2-dehydrogenase